MVGGRDRMTYDIASMENLLKSARRLKIEETITGKKNEELTFLNRCLDLLEPHEKDIIKRTYEEGVSMRKYSLYSGFSRNFIAKTRKETVALLVRFFNLKFAE